MSKYFNIQSGSSVVSINGKTFRGKNVSMVNGKIIVDGVEVDGEDHSKLPEIKVEVHGNTGQINTETGNVSVLGDVEGNVKTMSGDVDAKEVYGAVKTMSGDVTCHGSIGGSVDTMSGDIRCK
ncbi:hypothetical protein [Vibrio phage RYC]|nr:hypothetical protein [Vibrio phage RYC]